MLRTVFEARKIAIDTIRNIPAIKAITSPSDQWKAIFGELKKCPLNVYGQASNYNNAFHRTDHELWHGKFIYYGEASVKKIPKGFQLVSVKSMPITKKDGTKCSLPTNILVLCNEMVPRDLMEEKTIKILNKAIHEGKQVSWCAYGEFVLNEEESAVELMVGEPQHIDCYSFK